MVMHVLTHRDTVLCCVWLYMAVMAFQIITFEGLTEDLSLEIANIKFE